MADDQDFQQRMAGIEALTRQVDRVPDPTVRAVVKELLQSVMELHGSALTRMLELIHERGSEGANTIDALGRDPLIGSLLVLYGLHPLDTPARVALAMERLAPAFRKHSAEVELLGVEETIVRLRIAGGLNPTAGRALKTAIEDQIYALAPDVTRIEGLGALGASDLVAVESLAAAGSAWRNGAALKDGD
jgi:Fe-S cluster biogenesis protein NfuA